MTNAKFFEENNISFAKAMKAFNKQKKFKSFDKFLAAERYVFKFKVGDIIVLDNWKELPRAEGFDHNVVCAIMNIKDDCPFPYLLRALTPCKRCHAGEVFGASKEFVEENCILY